MLAAAQSAPHPHSSGRWFHGAAFCEYFKNTTRLTIYDYSCHQGAVNMLLLTCGLIKIHLFYTVRIRTEEETPLLPLGGEDAVEDGALPAVSDGLQDKHVLDDVKREAVVRE